MNLRTAACLLAVVAGAGAAPLDQATPQAPLTLEQASKLAGSYVEQYERRLGGIVAEETYRQTATESAGPRGGSGASTRTTKSRAYLFSVSLGSLGWVAFRDVFEIDGRPVRGREERLSQLLQHVTPESSTRWMSGCRR